jgi:hypothetical protein
LIVGGALLLIAACLGWLATRSMRRAGVPMPEEAIAEAHATVDELKEARTA